MKYDIDGTTCTQKLICESIKSASHNVATGKGSSYEKIFDGITRFVRFHLETLGNFNYFFFPFFQFIMAFENNTRYRNQRCLPSSSASFEL